MPSFEVQRCSLHGQTRKVRRSLGPSRRFGRDFNNREEVYRIRFTRPLWSHWKYVYHPWSKNTSRAIDIDWKAPTESKTVLLL
jgi:hypothetical protein